MLLHFATALNNLEISHHINSRVTVPFINNTIVSSPLIFPRVVFFTERLICKINSSVIKITQTRYEWTFDNENNVIAISARPTMGRTQRRWLFTRWNFIRESVHYSYNEDRISLPYDVLTGAHILWPLHHQKVDFFTWTRCLWWFLSKSGLQSLKITFLYILSPLWGPHKVNVIFQIRAFPNGLF